jgi:hypothetical protein
LPDQFRIRLRHGHARKVKILFSATDTTQISHRWVDHALLLNQQGFTRLAIPTAILLAAIILADAYSNPKKRWPLKPLFGPILGFALAYLVQLSPWALPAPVLAWGGGISVLLVSTLRLTFPPVTDRPQAANAPAYWQKLELLPLSPGLKSGLLPCAILLAVILYLLKK